MAYRTLNPFNAQTTKTFPDISDRDLEAAISRADAAYGAWSTKPFPQRAAVLRRAATLLRERVDEFARLVTLEMGKLFGESREEVKLSADILEYYADQGEAFLARWFQV